VGVVVKKPTVCFGGAKVKKTGNEQSTGTNKAKALLKRLKAMGF
jgi:hypothetical protein